MPSNDRFTCPLISVVICTHDRADLLHFPLESLALQQAPDGLFEVLVVDNAWGAGTAEVVASYRRSDQRIRYVREKAVGLSHARNCGFREARGEYVAYTDDDCRLPETWLAHAQRIIEERSPGCFGGPVYPFYDAPKPVWFKDSYGTRERATTSGPLTGGGNLMGGNLFVRRDLLERHGGFDPRFGMSGGRIGYAEEADFQERLRRADPPVVPFYDPQLFVYHLVRRDKMRVGWALRAAFAKGRDAVGAFPEREDRQVRSGSRALLVAQGLRAAGAAGVDLLRALVVRDRRLYPRVQSYWYEETTRRFRRLGSIYGLLRSEGRTSRAPFPPGRTS